VVAKIYLIRPNHGFLIGGKLSLKIPTCISTIKNAAKSWDLMLIIPNETQQTSDNQCRNSIKVVKYECILAAFGL
jgi:hypothetical protein